MTWLIVALGAVMTLVGGASIFVNKGLTLYLWEIPDDSASFVVFSCGAVVLAMAAILVRLENLRRTLERGFGAAAERGFSASGQGSGQGSGHGSAPGGTAPSATAQHDAAHTALQEDSARQAQVHEGGWEDTAAPAMQDAADGPTPPGYHYPASDGEAPHARQGSTSTQFVEIDARRFEATAPSPPTKPRVSMVDSFRNRMGRRPDASPAPSEPQANDEGFFDPAGQRSPPDFGSSGRTADSQGYADPGAGSAGFEAMRPFEPAAEDVRPAMSEQAPDPSRRGPLFERVSRLSARAVRPKRSDFDREAAPSPEMPVAAEEFVEQPPAAEGEWSGAATTEAPNAEQPAVMGRYEAGGASYVLYSDGSIEVETEGRLHRFTSMQDLKAYLEQPA